MGRALPEGAQGRGTPRPQTLRRREHPRVGLAPLSKGAGCGESRRLGDCLEAGSRSRKAAQGGTLRVAAASGGGISGRGNPSDRTWRRGHLPLTREANCRAGPATNRETTILALPRTCVGDDACIVPHPAAAQTHRVGSRFRGRHFGAGQSLRPRLAARPPPFDKGGKLRGGARNQPGNRDLDVIANPCRGRFYIGPVCGGANAPGRIWNPPLQWFFQCCSQPGNHDPRVTANLCRGRCLHRPAPRGGANTPGGQPLPGAAFRGGAIPPTAPGGAATSL